MAKVSPKVGDTITFNIVGINPVSGRVLSIIEGTTKNNSEKDTLAETAYEVSLTKQNKGTLIVYSTDVLSIVS